MKAEAEYKKELQERSMKDRKEKAKEQQPASVGRNLNFGANLVKFEPPKEQRGGWGWARNFFDQPKYIPRTTAWTMNQLKINKNLKRERDVLLAKHFEWAIGLKLFLNLFQ